MLWIIWWVLWIIRFLPLNKFKSCIKIASLLYIVISKFRKIIKMIIQVIDTSCFINFTLIVRRTFRVSVWGAVWRTRYWITCLIKGRRGGSWPNGVMSFWVKIGRIHTGRANITQFCHAHAIIIAGLFILCISIRQR